MEFDGLSMSMGNLSRLSNAQTRSISPENFTGAPGRGGMATEGTGAQAARDLGQGWKVSPSVIINPGETFELADIIGSGAIQQIWMTPNGDWHLSVLRIYWDGQGQPSVECPLSDFFACGWGESTRLSSLAVCVNPKNGLNCYWEMPFRARCRISIENRSDHALILFYQINYTLTDVPQDRAYFHAQFRSARPLPYKEVYTILDDVKGQGQFVGLFMNWETNYIDWWGEGEIKFYLDGDKDFPTICGTGVEDYFCGSYGFENPETGRYQEYSTPYSGLSQIGSPGGSSGAQNRFALYRWHIPDPIRFGKELRVTIQALGITRDERYVVLQDHIASVAYWYQTLPTAPFPSLLS